MRMLIYVCLASFLLLSCPAPSGASEDQPLFSSNARALLFADVMHPAASTQSPDNALLQLPRYSGELDLRPDLFWDSPLINATFKPRFTTAYRWWDDGVPDGRNDALSRAFVNEWCVQGKPSSQLYLSFGKEKLLWGPSFLESPSNILFSNTEKVNPKREVEGKYLARLIAVPTNALTLTAGSETQREDDPFGVKVKPLRFLKADLVGSEFAISGVGYLRQHDRLRMGSYGQWTESDALVLYYDGLITKGTDVLYPAGETFTKVYADSSRLFPEVSLGGSYTFLSGSTLSFEFLYNGTGYTDSEAADYYRLRQDAAVRFSDPLSRKTLAQALNIGQPFLRKYYVLGQFQFRDIRSVADLIVRYLYNIEEHAGQASTILEWQLTDRIQFFNINSVAVSHARETEFRTIADKSFMAGIEIHF